MRFRTIHIPAVLALQALLLAGFSRAQSASPAPFSQNGVEAAKQAPVSSAGRPLSRAEVMRRTAARHPDLDVAAQKVTEAEGRLKQATVKPSPELSFESENFGGIHHVGVFHSTEMTLQLSRRLERGGKREKRLQVAAAERETARRAGASLRSERLADAAEAYENMLAAQERLTHRRMLAELASQVHTAVSEQVAAGKVSPVEEVRALAERESARLEAESAGRAVTMAAERLAAALGDSEPDFSHVEGPFSLPEAGLASDVSGHPDLAVLASEVEAAAARIAQEEAERSRDITVSAGVKYLQEVQGTAFVAGVNLPLTRRDSRAGALAEVRAQLAGVQAQSRAIAHARRSEFAAARRELETAAAEATSLRDRVLPPAEQAFASVSEGFRYGKFGVLEVLDAQRRVAELRGRLLELVASARLAWVNAERASGGFAAEKPRWAE